MVAEGIEVKPLAVLPAVPRDVSPIIGPAIGMFSALVSHPLKSTKRFICSQDHCEQKLDNSLYFGELRRFIID